MGYPMARNLRVKVPADDILVIYDANESATQRFVDELGTTVKGIVVASNVKEVAEKSVSLSYSLVILSLEYFLSAFIVMSMFHQ